MITEDKITEIFCAVDEFCKEFDKKMDKKSLMSSEGKPRRYRKASLSDSEIMTILIAFQRFVPQLQALLPVLYQAAPEVVFPRCRVVQPLRGTGEQGVLPDDVLPQPLRLRSLYGHQFCGLHDDSRMPQPATLCQQGVQGAGH